MGAKFNNNESLINNFFMDLQDKMDSLINFLLERSMITNTGIYINYVEKANDSLNSQNFEEYFNGLLQLMKNLFTIATENKAE